MLILILIININININVNICMHQQNSCKYQGLFFRLGLNFYLQSSTSVTLGHHIATYFRIRLDVMKKGGSCIFFHYFWTCLIVVKTEGANEIHIPSDLEEVSSHQGSTVHVSNFQHSLLCVVHINLTC